MQDDVSMDVQAIDRMSLQLVSNEIAFLDCLAFSIAFDGATVCCSSYVGVRVLYYNNVKPCNVHLLAIPMYGSPTGKEIFAPICTLLYAIVGGSLRT